MSVGFDVISDLNLGPNEQFDWSEKAQSLYCIVAGNISADLRIIHRVLFHLASVYQGVFYVAGRLEYESAPELEHRTYQLETVCNNIKNVTLLNHRVVIINGVAILGTTGWYGAGNINTSAHSENVFYLGASLERLQLHLDVDKIVLVTHSVPGPELFFGEEDLCVYDQTPLMTCLASDTMHKVTHWVFGDYKKDVDTVMSNIHYVNHSCYGQNPYWPKRINV